MDEAIGTIIFLLAFLFFLSVLIRVLVRWTGELLIWIRRELLGIPAHKSSLLNLDDIFKDISP